MKIKLNNYEFCKSPVYEIHEFLTGEGQMNFYCMIRGHQTNGLWSHQYLKYNNLFSSFSFNFFQKGGKVHLFENKDTIYELLGKYFPEGEIIDVTI